MKDTDTNDSLNYLYFRCVCVCVCVCLHVCVYVGGGSSKTFVSPMHPKVGVTQSPTYQRSMENLVPGGKNSVLNWVLKLNHLFNFFEVLNLVFAGICNEKDKKIFFFGILLTPLCYIHLKVPDVAAWYIFTLSVRVPPIPSSPHHQCTTIVNLAF